MAEHRGEDLLVTAARHIGEPYRLGARAEMDNPDYAGPWDCAEFVSWCVWQTYAILFGVMGAGRHADPHSGAWIRQARERQCWIDPAQAERTPGAILLRERGERLGGHVAISDGQGGTIEARGARYGVVRARVRAPGRIWHGGCLIPGVGYCETGLLRTGSPRPD